MAKEYACLKLDRVNRLTENGKMKTTSVDFSIKYNDSKYKHNYKNIPADYLNPLTDTADIDLTSIRIVDAGLTRLVERLVKDFVKNRKN